MPFEINCATISSSVISCRQPTHRVRQITALLLQANKVAEQHAAKAAEAIANQAPQGMTPFGETMKGREEAAQPQHPIKGAAQAAADSHFDFAEHQTAAETVGGPAAAEAASRPAAAVNTAPSSVLDGGNAVQPAAASQPSSDMPASSLLSSCDHTGAAAAAGKGSFPASHLPWQPSQARHCPT